MMMAARRLSPANAVMLALSGPITDFTLSPDTQGIFQSVMGFAFVEPDLGAALHVGIKQPNR